jgi:hypothetical protein
MTNLIMKILALPVRQALVPCALITLATAAGVVVARRPGYLVSQKMNAWHSTYYSGCLKYTSSVRLKRDQSHLAKAIIQSYC